MRTPIRRFFIENSYPNDKSVPMIDWQFQEASESLKEGDQLEFQYRELYKLDKERGFRTYRTWFVVYKEVSDEE